MRAKFPRLPGTRANALIAANSAWLIADRFVRGLLGLLIGTWVARHLGPDRFGSLAYVLAYLAMFQAIATAGIDGIVVRDLSRHPEDSRQLLGSACLLRVACGLVAWLAALGVMALVDRADTLSLTLVAIAGSVMVFQAAEVLDLWFQSRSLSRHAVTAKLTALVGSSALKVGLILSDAPLPAFAAVTAVEALFVAIGLAVMFRSVGIRGRWRASLWAIRALLLESWPMMLSAAGIAIYMRLDQLMVRHILGDASLGLYAAVLPFSQVWAMLPMAIATSLAPHFARLRVADSLAYRRQLTMVFRYFFYAGVATFLVMSAVAKPLIALLLGEVYEPAWFVVSLHSLSNAFCFLGIAHSLWMTNEGLFRVRLLGTLAAGAAMITVNLTLLEPLGLAAAGVAAIVAQAVAALLINAWFDREGFRMQVKALLLRDVRA